MLILFLKTTKKKHTGKRFETIDPRNGEVIAKIAEGEKADVDLAVEAARRAFDKGPWPRFPASVSLVFFFFFFLILT